MTTWRKGLRENIYLAGTHLANGPEGLRWSAAYLETADYVLDSSALVTRAPTWGTATMGAPDSPRKWRVEMTYRLGGKDVADATCSAEYFALQRLAASAGLFDLCLFKPIVETFSVCSGRTSFRLSAGIAVRQSGVSGVPGCLPGGLTLAAGYGGYATEVYADGVAISPTWESARDANGRQAFTPALTYGVGSVIKVVYVPVFTARRVDASPVFQRPCSEFMRLVMETY